MVKNVTVVKIVTEPVVTSTTFPAKPEHPKTEHLDTEHTETPPTTARSSMDTSRTIPSSGFGSDLNNAREDVQRLEAEILAVSPLPAELDQGSLKLFYAKKCGELLIKDANISIARQELEKVCENA
jgi:hypothetical protein